MNLISNHRSMQNYTREKNNSINFFFLLLLLPPIFSLLFATIKLFEKRGSIKVMTFSFSFFYALLLTYLTPYYDTIQRFWDFKEPVDLFTLNFDPLTISGSFLVRNLQIQSFHIFFIFYFLIILLTVRSFLNNKNLTQFSILIAITIIYCRNIGDLTYYTLAVSVTLYFANKYKIKLWNILVLIVVLYLIHPGIFLILLPAIILFYLIKLEYYKLSIIYLIVFFAITFRLFSITEPLPNVDNEFVNQFVNMFNSYVSSEGQWGRRVGMEELSEGLRLNLFVIIVKLLMLFVVYELYIYRKSIKNKFVLSIYIITVILYFSAYNLYTINERVIVTNLILGAYLLVPILEMINNKKLKLYYGSLVVFVFFLSLSVYNPPRDIIFRESSSSYDITFRTIYVPSFMLMFYDNLGYSDHYLLQNAKYNPVYNPKDKY